MVFDMKRGNFLKDMQPFAKAKQGDLLALMIHKRNLLSRWWNPGEIKEITRRIELPLLVIKDNAYEREEVVADWVGWLNGLA